MTEQRAAYTLGDPRTETETCWDVFQDGTLVGEICLDENGVYEVEMLGEGQYASLDAALSALADCCDDMADMDPPAGSPDPGGLAEGDQSMMPRSTSPATIKRSVPTDNVVRAMFMEPVELRADAQGDGNTMVGHFAVFNRWTKIDSFFEGTFMERVAPGAFADEFASRGDQIRVLYDHGADPTIGNKPLGVAEVLREDKTGAYAEVRLFDAGYVNDLKPAIRAGQLGQSFRFQVLGEEWNTPNKATRDNPNRLEERTITKVRLYEFGPVTFPAYADATVGLRSRTDEFWDRLIDDPAFVARFTERVGAKVATKVIQGLPADGRNRKTTKTPADGGVQVPTNDEIRKWVASRLYTPQGAS
jgi:HK97 family phage prohead protease